MGLFDFIKNAGASIFGAGKSDEELAAEMEGKIKEHIEQYNLEIADLTVKVEDDKVTLGGIATSQEAKEKAVLAAGNVEGIATVEDNIVVEIPTPPAVFHTVERGDSLSKIAKKVYGDPMKYPLIFEANKPMLKDPNLIYPGQVLRCPPITE